uniref:ZP domain-containing protein n=1 Tax=Romanomermis culicivorax TaxID=13658 RepID=A0A915KWI2_ROMCU
MTQECPGPKSRASSPLTFFPQVDPPGLLVSSILVVSFHPMFVTKTDKAFHVKCFYLTSEKPVTTGLDVSMFSTQMVTQKSPTPTCKYEVLDNGPNGSPLKYAVVGQEVYHKWTCESEISKVTVVIMHRNLDYTDLQSG